jgi:hypothetical protein
MAKRVRVKISDRDERSVAEYLKNAHEDARRQNRVPIVWIKEMELRALCPRKVLHTLLNRYRRRKWIRPENPRKMVGAYEVLPGIFNFFETPAPDGTMPPDKFWYAGKCTDGLTPAEFELLDFVWRRRNDLPLVLEASDQWSGTANRTKHFHTYKKRVNDKLMAARIPLKMRAKSGFVILEETVGSSA